MNIYTGMVVYRFKGVIKGTFVTRVCNVYSSEYCREFFVHTVGKYEIPIPITCQYIISHTKPNSLVWNFAGRVHWRMKINLNFASHFQHAPSFHKSMESIVK